MSEKLTYALVDPTLYDDLVVLARSVVKELESCGRLSLPTGQRARALVERLGPVRVEGAGRDEAKGAAGRDVTEGETHD